MVERIDHFQKDLVRLETNLVEVRKIHQEALTQIALTIKDVGRLEKKQEEVHARRWDILKLVLAALLGGLISSGVAGRMLDHFQPAITKQARP